MFVLDTNTLIYFFKGQGQVAGKLLSISPKKIGIPTVVIYELEYGIAKSSNPHKRQQQLYEICSLINIIPFNTHAARCAAMIRANLEQQGTPIGHYDLLIAGTTIANRGTLVTHNIKEFCRIPDLQFIDWYND
jgi:tRNA(fMet)-specific endonuclease VapC